MSMFLRAAQPLRQVLRSRAYSAESVSYAQALLNAPETRVTVLDNGLRVATEQTPHQTATVGVYIDAGSRFENPTNNGTAHFLEHMAFKGTSKRTQQQLELEVEAMGAHLNAYTSREQTVYYAKSFAKDVPHMTEILSDILQNSLLSSSAIEVERGVILREMAEVASQPDELVFDHLHSVAYQGTPLGLTILGPEENVKSITGDDLRAYIKTNYTPSRMVLAAAGGVDHDQLVKAAEQHFSSLPGDSKELEVAPPCPFTGTEIRDRNDTIPQAHVAIAIEGVGWSHPDYFPLMVASSLVGSWDRSFGGQNMSSKLAQSAATNQLAHSYTSFFTCYSDTSLWGTYAVTDHLTLDDFLFELQQEWMRLCTSVGDAEIERAKNQLKASLLFQIDGTTPTCDEIGRQMLTYGRRMPAAEVDARISAITTSQVRAAANKYIFDKDPAVAGFGSVEGLTDYQRLRANMSLYRV